MTQLIAGGTRLVEVIHLSLNDVILDGSYLRTPTDGPRRFKFATTRIMTLLTTGNSWEASGLRSSTFVSMAQKDSTGICAGIDLGTSNSVIAILVNGVPEVVPNKEGDLLR